MTMITNLFSRQSDAVKIILSSRYPTNIKETKRKIKADSDRWATFKFWQRLKFKNNWLSGRLWKKKWSIRSHRRCSGVHFPSTHLRYLLPPAWTYPMSHTYWTRLPEAKLFIVMYLSARLEFLMPIGTLHRTVDQTEKLHFIRKEKEKNNKSKCRKRSSRSLAGTWVGTYVGRHRGGRGRHWPSGPQVICWAPSSWKPSTQVKFTLSPTRTVSPEGLRELATAGLEQVVSPAGPSKTDSSFSPSSLNKHSPPLCF